MATDGEENHVVRILQPRAYQLEMLRDSMRRNTIVVMDTGSGKTQIAVLRVAAELERCSHEKRVWFLCPTVALAEQQHHVMATQLPCYQARVLSGADGVDRWSEQRIWDDVLQDISIVICTHQVLLDALIHGFVKMQQISLIVFDEAHHCQSNHPCRRIMRDFYHSTMSSRNLELPHILGLTASPVINKKENGLQTIEQNMDSISRTPRVNREELLRYVHQPTMIALSFQPSDPDRIYSCSLGRLAKIHENLDIEQDPKFIKLRSSGDKKRTQQVRLNKKTYCQDQVKKLHSMANEINQEMGGWAADYYINHCVRKFLDCRRVDFVNSDALEDQERLYLMKAFEGLESPAGKYLPLRDDLRLSPKVCGLIETLVKEVNSQFAGLVFVKTRAAVAILAHLLSNHPSTKHMISVGTFVGVSNNASRKSNIGELADVREQAETLNDLRHRRKNLIIATSVLEEGIDVSACNVVICFEKPQSLKSFIQRRGRARKSSSKYIIMFEEGSGSTAAQTWQELEDNLKQIYLDDMRQIEEIQRLEAEEDGGREFVVESTGAKITLQDAVQHLYHFCSTLPATQYADLRPVFTYEEKNIWGVVRAKVTLPNCVDTSVREAQSSTWWKTEKSAKRDAAFEAYVALYHAGLVNEHLLPLVEYDEALAAALSPIQKRNGLVNIAGQFNPWQEVAVGWQSVSDPHEFSLFLNASGKKMLHMRFLFPFPLPKIANLDIYWSAVESFQAELRPTDQKSYHVIDTDALGRINELMLSSVYKNKVQPDKLDFPVLFWPAQGCEDMRVWLEKSRGTRDIYHLENATDHAKDIGLVRDMLNNGMPHIFYGSEYCPDEILMEKLVGGNTPGERFYVKASKLTKRSDFMHPVPLDQNLKSSKHTYLPASTVQVDNLPFAISQFAMFVPSIMHRIETSLITQHLCAGLLSSLQFKDLHLITTAISASVAREATNYQRLEFLGDSCLKIYTSVNVMAHHLTWHEGYLSSKKDHLVSNTRLALAAQHTGLDKYILTKPFTGRKWKPLYNADLLGPDLNSTREISTKTLADVVEATIGAAFLDGGPEKVIKCLSIFLPEIRWLPLHERLQTLSIAIDPSIDIPAQFVHLEVMIGHAFDTKPLLLEALTHVSHIGPNTAPSYERLEFLGDSVLDSLVSTALFNHSPDLSHQIMHLCRTALVNANFLAFLCMDLSKPTLRMEPVEDKTTGQFSTIETTVQQSIWHFMRFSSYDVALAQQRCLTRFHQLRPTLRTALDQGDHYPWLLLSQLDADKFFSDIIESVLGAIYIDTLGSVPACQAFLDKLGISTYLARLIGGDVKILHPKEELGRVAGEEKVKYDVWVEDREAEMVARGREMAARVFVGGREVGRYEGAKSRIEAETGAAEMAVNALRAESTGGALRKGNVKGVCTKAKSVIAGEEEEEEAEEEAEEGEQNKEENEGKIEETENQ